MNKSIKYISSIGVFALLLGTAISCSEEEPIYVPPTFKLNEVSNIMRTTATFSGSISGDMSKISEYGFEYSTVEEFTTSTTNKVVVGETPTSSSCQAAVTGLEANERYYYRLYATTGASKVYSEAEYFQTAASSAPLLSALVVDSIGENLARFKCTIEDIGDEHLIEYGVGYKTQNDQTYIPIPSDSIIPLSVAGSDNTFFVEIVDLQPATKYSFRPYAKNSTSSDGSTGSREGYGEIVEKQTESLLSADVTTSEIADGHIGINSIQVSATFNGAAGSNDIIKACGFCWSENNTMPVITDDTLMLDPVRAGELFYATIKDLKPKTLYYVRAYAINTVNGVERVGYGEVYPATTLSRKVPILEIETEENEWGGKDFVFETEATSIHIKADITNYDSNALVEKGLIWSKTKGNITLEEAKKTKTFLSLDVKTGGKSIDGTIEGLEMYTSYYVKAYAVYRADGIDDVGYSEVLSIRTQNFQAPSLELEINDEKVTRNTAEFVGRVRDEGNGTISERGFVYIEGNISPEPTLRTKGVNKVVSDETFTKVIKELSYNTQYAARSYAISKLAERVDTVYSGGWHFFTTKSVLQPNFNNVNLSDATYCSFKATCGITELGDGKLLEKGFYYKKGDPDFSAGKDSTIVKSDAYDEFSMLIENVDYDHRYYVRAYAKEEVDGVIVIYTSGVSEIWIPAPNSTSFAETKLDDVTYESVKATSGITELGDGKLLEKGFYYTTIPWDFSKEKDSLIVESDLIETFSGIINGLNYNTDYYVCAYAKKELKGGEIRIATSPSHHVWIPAPSSTQFGELVLDSATYHSFVAKSGILEKGDGKLLEKGFYWKADGTDFENGVDSLVVKSGNNDEFSAVIEGLQSNKWHYVGAYTKLDVDGDIFVHRSGWNSIWVHGPNMPSFNYNTDGGAYKQLKLTATITSMGDGEIIEEGFCWRMVGEEDWEHPTLELNDGFVTIKDTLSTFTHTIKNLEPGKEYYSRAYVKVKLKNGERIGYSGTHGITLSSVELPEVSDWFNISERTRNSVVVRGSLNNDGNGEITHRGFVVSNNAKNPLPAIGDCDYKWDDVDESFTKTLTGLKHNTEYALRAFVVASFDGVTDTIYNRSARTFWTTSVQLPEFKRPTFDKVDLTSFTVSSVITAMGEGKLKEKGFCWNRVTSDFDLNTETTTSRVVTGDSLYIDMKNLETNTTYYMKAYAKVEVDGIEYTAYSDQASQRTSSYNHTSLHNTTVDGEKTTRNSAFLSGAFNSSGNGTIVEKGFVLSKTSVTSEPTLENNVKKVIAADDFTATVTGLDWNTEYAVRTYAICKWEASDFKETVYSNWRTTFRTKNVELPKFNNVAVDSITYSSFKVASGIASLGDGEDALVEKGFVWLLNEEQNYWDAPTFDAYTGYMKVDSDSIKSFEVKVKNLLPGQRYTVRTYAKVTIDGQETVGYSNAHSLSTPSLGIDCWLESQATTCNVEMEFREEADKVKDVYVNVAETEGENADKWTKFALTKDEATGRYKGVVDNLRGNTNYYLKLIYQYAGNDVVCDGVWSFTTKRTPSVNDNVSPGKKEDE